MALFVVFFMFEEQLAFTSLLCNNMLRCLLCLKIRVFLFLLRHCFTLCIVWFLSFLMFKLLLVADSIGVLLLLFLPILISSFTFLELYYGLKPVIKLHTVVKWFYYVVFALSLLFPIYYAQHA